MNPIAIKPAAQGKVRDIYDLGDSLLMVSTDRISAFDCILDDEIPFKGKVLTQLSCFWFERLSGVMGNHLISADVADLPPEFRPYSDYLEGRFMLVRKARMLPVECIVRGYLAGGGYKEYEQTGCVCGIGLPQGLANSSRLPQTLFTPSTKAEQGDHDENVSFDRCVELLGRADAEAIRSAAVELYETARDYAAQRGVIIADTKFEFGFVDGKLVLADEALTPDSSRFWSAQDYKEGREQASFDKQFVRNWLLANWDGTGRPPRLPEEVIAQTSEKYIQAYEKITGRVFER